MSGTPVPTLKSSNLCKPPDLADLTSTVGKSAASRNREPICRRKSDQIFEKEKTLMNNQPAADQNIGNKTPSPIQPSDRDKIQPIRHWQQRYERFLFLSGLKATHERYSRAVERFLSKFPEKTYAHQFLRPVINDYVESRLKEGNSVATVRLEMSAIRGFFQFMLDMGAVDVMFNPAKNIKVRKPKTGSPPTVAGGQNES